MLLSHRPTRVQAARVLEALLRTQHASTSHTQHASSWPVYVWTKAQQKQPTRRAPQSRNRMQRMKAFHPKVNNQHDHTANQPTGQANRPANRPTGQPTTPLQRPPAHNLPKSHISHTGMEHTHLVCTMYSGTAPWKKINQIRHHAIPLWRSTSAPPGGQTDHTHRHTHSPSTSAHPANYTPQTTVTIHA